MEIRDMRPETNRKPIPKNWGLVPEITPSGYVPANWMWMIDLDAPMGKEKFCVVNISSDEYGVLILV